MTGETAGAVTTYDAWREFAASWGLIFFGVIFLGVLVYVFWPSRRKAFEAAAQMPLREDDDDVSGHV